jgi:hypothetical protein
MSVNIYSRRAHEPSALIFKSSSKPGRRLFGSSSRPDSVNSTASSSSSSSSSPIGIAFTAGRSAHASTPFEYSKPVTTTSLQERVELLQDSDNVLVSAENLLFLETQHKLAVSSVSKSFALFKKAHAYAKNHDELYAVVALLESEQKNLYRALSTFDGAFRSAMHCVVTREEQGVQFGEAMLERAAKLKKETAKMIASRQRIQVMSTWICDTSTSIDETDKVCFLSTISTSALEPITHETFSLLAQTTVPHLSIARDKKTQTATILVQNTSRRSIKLLSGMICRKSQTDDGVNLDRVDFLAQDIVLQPVPSDSIIRLYKDQTMQLPSFSFVIDLKFFKHMSTVLCIRYSSPKPTNEPCTPTASLASSKRPRAKSPPVRQAKKKGSQQHVRPDAKRTKHNEKKSYIKRLCDFFV